MAATGLFYPALEWLVKRQGKTGNRALISNARSMPSVFRKELENCGDDGLVALHRLERHDSRIVFRQNGGSYYDPNGNWMVINVRGDRAGPTLVHEATHLEYHFDGRAADVNRFSRNEFISRRVEEEAVATARQMSATNHLRKLDPSVKGSYLYDRYAAGKETLIPLREFVAGVQGAPFGSAERAAAGHEGATIWLARGFQDGRILTSTTNEPYPAYYGKFWDAVHGVRT